MKPPPPDRFLVTGCASGIGASNGTLGALPAFVVVVEFSQPRSEVIRR